MTKIMMGSVQDGDDDDDVGTNVINITRENDHQTLQVCRCHEALHTILLMASKEQSS